VYYFCWSDTSPGISILYTIGGILVVIGVILWILGAVGRPVGGRNVWY
jgi:hypothetical protein